MKISQLQDTIEDRNTLISRLQDEIQFFKLEMINKEVNFNKIFNNTPNVGVYRPSSAGKVNLIDLG